MGTDKSIVTYGVPVDTIVLANIMKNEVYDAGFEDETTSGMITKKENFVELRLNAYG